MKLFKLLKTTIRGSALAFILANIFFVSLALFQVLDLLLQKELVDDVVNSSSLTTKTFIFVATILVLRFLILSGPIDNFFRGFVYNYLAAKIEQIYQRLFLYETYITKNEKYYNKEFNDKVEISRSNVYKVTMFVLDLITFIFEYITKILSVMLLVALFDASIILIVFIYAFIRILFEVFYNKKIRNMQIKASTDERITNYYKDLSTSREYAKELRVNKLNKKFIHEYSRHYDDAKIKIFRAGLFKQIVNGIFDILKYIMDYVIVFVLLYSVYNKSLSVGEFVMLYSALTTLTSTLVATVNKSSQLHRNYLGVKILLDFIDLDNAKKLNSKGRGKGSKSNFDTSDIKVENVSYRYENANSDALKDISLTIGKGETVSILGYNGSGKTTLSKILIGLLEPKSGKIYVNNVLVSDKNRFDNYDLFGITYQDFVRYSLSLKENIGFGSIDDIHDKELFREVLSDEGIEKVLGKLPNKENSYLGKEFTEDGVDLSGGEWQKIAIARAKFGNRPIMVMDEPTASIDPFEEERLINQFKDILRDKTAILISHRLSFARIADRIIMMDKGNIVEVGTHNELLAKDGLYKEIYELQKDLYTGGDQNEK